mmetsp:Transcript_42152/g.55531  ORF Transcript_42152/g.55531 Transcript_42152/m.55531 type:complete len:192 (-) Transcript_42152:1631-2206(-)|eukprot:CAMPEP_0185583008 /NCGR_PEP_ID=MMETSP0434-20130131/21259_1 /TAXON_ID=626734 ORGANISM="Favella taraikaensis, Strain Fe Narragansett Bay" /NCGR_SAMPLE_ID=MMETSP0434 /ASSEMBLY_ACC=CAM_ASM_000379 /LENGTH=191 /DNA_ID=CAMNT_0028201983 /DNA_START=462 /DNA_END=1037 /DNA_ORIENTATION=+
MQLFEEEVVDRYQQKSVTEMNLSTSIKDWFRVNQVSQVVTLLSQVLQNHAIFESKTVKGTLKVLATLIDWNEISLFDDCRAYIGGFLRASELRAGAFQFMAAFVGKGMSELDKLVIIKESGYLEEVRDARYVLLTNYEDNFGSQEYDEEKNYMTAVSNSVCHMGKWTLSAYQPPGSPEDPFKTPESRQYFD